MILAGIDDSPLPAGGSSVLEGPDDERQHGGTPKIVRSTAGAWIDRECHRSRALIPREAVQLVVAPMTHSAPFTYAFRGLMTGTPLIIHPRFDERRVLAEIAASRITWTMLVPTMLHRIRQVAGSRSVQAADVSSLESVVHIGAPCAPELKRQWLEWLGPDRVTEVYAGTESRD